MRRVSGLLLGLLLAGAAAGAREVPVKMTAAELAAAVADAPQLPAKLDFDLPLKLIDFISCTNVRDPHDFMDQGTSRVTTGPAGRYRVTAPHRHAFFSYRFRSAGRDRPVLIVIEYPDDADRSIYFGTHESGLTGRPDLDWGVETGVSTGTPLPPTNRMQRHTFFLWPQDEWPCLIVANWGRQGGAGAASRVWVYAIDGDLPRLAVAEPDPAHPRRFGHWQPLGPNLATRLFFGLNSPEACRRLADYFAFVGVNELGWSVVSDNRRNFGCVIPGWDNDGGQAEHLDQVLSALDAKGGMAFVAGFDLAEDFRIGGGELQAMDDDALKDALGRGFDAFLERYGKYQSLQGIALGAQDSNRFLDFLNARGVLKDVVARLKSAHPELPVIVSVGGHGRNQEYFDGKHGKDAGDVISRWEAAGEAWSDFLGLEAAASWQAWGRDPVALRRAGLVVAEQYQPSDHWVYPVLARQPRALCYFDLDGSRRRSELAGGDRCHLWSTPAEGWLGLLPGYNFWYQKLWVAPDFNAPPPRSLAALARSLEHRDRLAISAGSWNINSFGREASLRRFAKAFRSLPPGPMQDLDGLPVDVIRVRWAVHQGHRHVAVLSLIPFELAITVDGRNLILPPYELLTLVGAGDKQPSVTAVPCTAYRVWVENRIEGFERLAGEVKALSAEAVPAGYDQVAAAARQLFAEGKLRAADLALGWGLVNELQLRRDLLAPPEIRVPRVAAVPPLSGDLNAWPKGASDQLLDTGEHLAGHLHFPNSWQGPADLSARIRLAHDGQRLYLGVEVNDDVLENRDACVFRLSRQAYLDWRSLALRPDLPGWNIIVPAVRPQTGGRGPGGFSYTCRRTPKGYVLEGSAPLRELRLAPGESIGFLMLLTDHDGTRNLYRAGWSAKQALLFPNRQNFDWQEDPRACGKLVIE